MNFMQILNSFIGYLLAMLVVEIFIKKGDKK